MAILRRIGDKLTSKPNFAKQAGHTTTPKPSLPSTKKSSTPAQGTNKLTVTTPKSITSPVASKGRVSTGGGGGGGGNGTGGFNPGDIPELIPPEMLTLIIVGVVVLVLIAILFGTLVTIGRYISESALIQMVNMHEETGEKYTIKQGFKLGWSRSAWRLFLIGLVIGLPLAVFFIFGFVLALSPLLLWITEINTLGILGTVSAIGLFFLMVVLAIVVGTIVNTLLYFFWRVCVLEQRGVFESIREGFALAKQNFKDVGLMWLYMAIINFVAGILLMMVFFLIIILAAIAALLPALLVGGLASLFMSGPWPWVIAAAVGMPIFILIISIPSLFIGGVLETFKSTVWTLTYRELRAGETWGDELDVIREA